MYYRIVAHGNINPSDYCTISAKGVSRVRNNSEADFTELDRWEEEYHYYTKLVQIPLFALFRRWKAFTTWRKNVRSRKITNCKKQLQENLFIVNQVKAIVLINDRHISYYSIVLLSVKIFAVH